MCCLFGILDYKSGLSDRQKRQILSILSIACEARGTDASGIAYRSGNQLCIYKRPLPAHLLRFRVPAETGYIMGHTRMTTQGSEQRNCNNHPFSGRAGGVSFALAHNGVLYNDKELRRSEKLPVTDIETDSYVAVQLIERYDEVGFAALRFMAEQVRGSFTFTILDSRNTFYVVKGSNPFCLYHWRKRGLYLYASTEGILRNALKQLPFSLERPERIFLEEGDLLRIDSEGRRGMEFFQPQSPFSQRQDYADIWEGSYGWTPEEVDWLIREGVTQEEIDAYFYCGEV